MPIRVADYIARTLAAEGVRHVFLVTGGGAMHLNDAFGREKGLEWVAFHHEQAAQAVPGSGHGRTRRGRDRGRGRRRLFPAPRPCGEAHQDRGQQTRPEGVPHRSSRRQAAQ